MTDQELEAIERRLVRVKAGVRPGDRLRTWIVDQTKLLAEVRDLQAQLNAVVDERDVLQADAEQLRAGRGRFAA